MKREVALKISHKILITLLAVSLLPLYTLWYLGQANVSRQVEASIAHNLTATMENVASHITDWDATNQLALRQAAQLDDVLSMKAERQNPILAAMGRIYNWSYLVFTTTPDGSSVGRNDGGTVGQYSDRAYFQQVAAGAEFGREVVIGKSTGKPALILAAPIGGTGSQRAGTIVMAMHLETVARTVADAHIGKTGHVVLIDAKNKVIANGGADKTQGTLQDFSAHPALGIPDITEQMAAYTDNGRLMVGMMRKLPQGWRILIEQEYAEAYAPLIQSKQQGYVLIAAAFVLVVLVALALGRQLSRPIVQLTAVADALSKGKLDVEIGYQDRRDEIGTLARSIKRLDISMRKAIERLRKQA